jgi:hypothetical protein
LDYVGKRQAYAGDARKSTSLFGRSRLLRSISPRQNNVSAKQFNRAASVRAAFGSQNAVVSFIHFQ